MNCTYCIYIASTDKSISNYKTIQSHNWRLAILFLPKKTKHHRVMNAASFENLAAGWANYEIQRVDVFLWEPSFLKVFWFIFKVLSTHYVLKAWKFSVPLTPLNTLYVHWTTTPSPSNTHKGTDIKRNSFLYNVLVIKDKPSIWLKEAWYMRFFLLWTWWFMQWVVLKKRWRT